MSRTKNYLIDLMEREGAATHDYIPPSSEKPYYPDIVTDKWRVCDGNGGYRERLRLRTYLRRCYDGVWYEQLFIETVWYKPNHDDVASVALVATNRLHRSVYTNLVLGVVSPDHTGFFPVADSQISESDRLRADLMRH